jgi:hypothetical protein
LAAPPGKLCKTFWSGLSVNIHRATVEDADRQILLPAGTVIRSDAQSAIVSCGRGVAKILELSDAIGPIPLKSLLPGQHLGINPPEVISRLEQRISDLEFIVRLQAQIPHSPSRAPRSEDEKPIRW